MTVRGLLTAVARYWMIRLLALGYAYWAWLLLLVDRERGVLLACSEVTGACTEWPLASETAAALLRLVGMAAA